jgi:hypothetical protein
MGGYAEVIDQPTAIFPKTATGLIEKTKIIQLHH